MRLKIMRNVPTMIIPGRLPFCAGGGGTPAGSGAGAGDGDEVEADDPMRIPPL